MAVSINIDKELNSQLARVSRPLLKKELQKSFQAKKNQMIADFLNHPVTLEINKGINSSNISGTLMGVTNLYSFIGFDSGDDPIEPILTLLQSTSFEIGSLSSKALIIRINFPEAAAIFKVTPMPWAPGRSWALGIARGISGLGYYLKRKSERSRSGLGLQSQNKKRSVKFKNTKYISNFIKNYKKEFENLEI